ncbi:unnamed protein product [Triticum turgidum subsp. durum]|uniref:Uncharacterized protein n=3 Tax=Triticum TaxID=4564 RepID=A0A9R0ZBL9_TRITD|nr:unnamed protein product [Triticum turgidum subsp. durum]
MEMLSLMIGELPSEEKSEFSGQTFGEYLPAGVPSIAPMPQLGCGVHDKSLASLHLGRIVKDMADDAI